MVENNTPPSSQAKTPPPPPSKLRSRLLPLVFLVILILGGLLGYLLLPPVKKVVDQAVDSLNGQRSVVLESSPAAAPEEPTMLISPTNQTSQPTPTEATAEPTADSYGAPPADSYTQPSAPTLPIADSYSSDTQLHDEIGLQIGLLQQTIGSLRSDLDQVRQGQGDQQALELRLRLRELTRPDLPATQVMLCWEDVALLPILSAAERDTALQARDQAREVEAGFRRWQMTIDRIVADQNRREQPFKPNWVVSGNNVVSDWLNRNFRFGKLPPDHSASQQRIRNAAEMVHPQLAAGLWPSAGAWRELLSVLASEGVRHDLPADLRPFAGRLEGSQAIAKDWQERL